MSRSVAAIAPLLALVIGCSKPPPPPEPPPPPPPPAPTVEAPPPPPKCEALDEGCKATAETRARVARSPLVFTPVTGWIYAQGENATIAHGGSETAPALVLTAYDSEKDSRKDIVARESAFEAMAKLVNLTLPKSKVNWRAPACQCKGTTCSGAGGEMCKQMKPAADLKAAVWQLDGGVRSGKKGPMLVVLAMLPDNKALLGLGFVPDDDSTGADSAILKSIESIAPAAAAAGAAPAASGTPSASPSGTPAAPPGKGK